MSIKDKLSRLPNSPGVYFFKNENDKIIYIGKAKILKNRVRSYFSGKSGKDPKTLVMIRHIVDVDWMVVRDEVEALLTEVNMIKEHRPRYNVLMKDDKTFPYLQITNESYPRIEVIRLKNLTKDGHTYFGPFTDGKRLRQVMRVIHKIFPLRTCSYLIDDAYIAENRGQICLDYHINRCEGPCEGIVSQKDYNKMISRILDFLKGKNTEIQSFIHSKMEDASQNKEFESAAHYRDQLLTIREFTKRQKKISQDFKNQDVVATSQENTVAMGVVMRIRNGHLIGREKFPIKIHPTDNETLVLSQFLMQYYSTTSDIPKEIIIEKDTEDVHKIESWLTQEKGNRVHIVIPQIGEKQKLAKMCRRNSDLLLKELVIRKTRQKELVPKMVAQLQEDLGLNVPPRRIEAFDNSNIQGAHPVAGMVCFVDGKPRKSEYRKFNIKTVEGIDDFASMKEVVFRRYKRVLDEKTTLPDLIVIDGGKGQLSSAKHALDDLGLEFIPIIGLAKKLEEVFKPNISEPQNIAKTSPGLFLLRQIRDEVHRYAITFHRRKRGKAMTKSQFEDIPGIGPKRLKVLWEKFDSVEAIQNASIEEIIEKTGFPLQIAKVLVTTGTQRHRENN